MFRFTDWFEKGHNFSGWKKHFEGKGINTEVRACAHGMTALFRSGAESVDREALSPAEESRRLYEERFGCECGWAQGWESRRGRRPGTKGEVASLA